MEVKLDNYYRLPKALMKLWRVDKAIGLPAFLLYVAIADRYQQSKKKATETGDYIDKEGRVFCLYSYAEMETTIGLKDRHAIAKGLKELEKLGLIERRRRFNASTAFYVYALNESVEKYTSVENYTTESVEKHTPTSVENYTNECVENYHTNKNNKIRTLSKNNISNNNKAVILEEDPLEGNKVATAIRQEIRLLLGSRKIKIDRVLMYCNDIQRLKRVFNFADRYKKLDGWIIACLRDGWEPQEPKKEAVECYNAADKWLKKLAEDGEVEETIYTTSEGVDVL